MDVSKLNFAEFDPASLDNEEQAIEILEYLAPRQRTPLEQYILDEICERFGFVVDDQSADLTLAEKAIIASDFYLFSRYIFKAMKGFSFKENWHHKLICDKVTDVIMGRSQPQLVINMPPRYSKTEIISVYLPCFVLMHSPDAEFILTCYSASLSHQNSSRVREILQSPAYLTLCNTQLDPGASARQDFKTLQGGRVFATSTGGTLTGVGAGKMREDSISGCFLSDDPIKSDEAQSDQVTDNCWDWFCNVARSRTNNERTTPFIVVAQRLSVKDPCELLLQEDNEFGVTFDSLLIPAILTKDQLDHFGVPEDDPSRIHGDPETDEYPLWHWKHDLEDLRRLRDANPTMFYGQYMQRPYVDGGGLIKSNWFETYNTADLRDTQVKKTCFVLDTASTTKTYSDYSVINVVDVLEGGIRIRDIIRGKWELPDLIHQVEKAFIRYRPREVWYEQASSGIGLAQMLRRSAHRMILKKIVRQAGEGAKDKITRTSSASPYIESGYVSLPESASWKKAFLEECEAFPNGAHDDMVDTLVDAVDQFIMPRVAEAPSPMELAKIVMTKKKTFGQIANITAPTENEEDYDGFDFNQLLRPVDYNPNILGIR